MEDNSETVIDLTPNKKQSNFKTLMLVLTTIFGLAAVVGFILTFLKIEVGSVMFTLGGVVAVISYLLWKNIDIKGPWDKKEGLDVNTRNE